MTTLSEPPIGNSVRFAARPLPGGGTPACIWLSAERRLPELNLTGCPELFVVGAHPDDETLGFGATAVMLAQRGVRVQVVSASDGGGSQPGLSLRQRHRLELTRRAELHRALDVLGAPPPICLGLPDGAIADQEARLADLLIEMLAVRPRGTWCAATWRGDGHPDHEAVGRAAALAAAEVGAELVEYPVWMWHWAVLSPFDDRDGPQQHKTQGQTAHANRIDPRWLASPRRQTRQYSTHQTGNTGSTGGLRDCARSQ